MFSELNTSINYFVRKLKKKHAQYPNIPPSMYIFITILRRDHTIVNLNEVLIIIVLKLY